MNNEQPIKKSKGIPAWIIENLLEFGNCYVRNDICYLPAIEKQCGFKIRKRRCEVVDEGYVLERVKE